MPFKSKKQERWMWANNPKLAREWENKYGAYRKRKKRKKR
jgi:hypothetical protein